MRTRATDRLAYWKGVKHLYENASADRAGKILRIDKRPIVIGGCGRSGTTLLLSILSCHPRIMAIDEETRAFSPGGYLPRPTLDAPFKFTKLYSHLTKCEIPDSASHWCEKTPKNVLYFKRLLTFYGDRVRIIQVVRDGRDVVVSRHPSNPGKFWVTPQRWVNDVCAGLDLSGHSQVLTVRYEDLIGHYRNTVRAICRFLGLSYVAAFNDYPRHAKLTRNAAWQSKAQPLYTRASGVRTGQAYERRLKNFYATTGAQELLHHYGYTTRSRLPGGVTARAAQETFSPLHLHTQPDNPERPLPDLTHVCAIGSGVDQYDRWSNY